MFIKKSLFIIVLLNFVNLYGVCILPVNGQPFIVGNQPHGIAFSPLINGKLFSSVVNVGNNTITTYEVNTSTGPSSGVFTQVGMPVATGIIPNDLAYSPFINNNLFVAVVNQFSNSVSVYSANTITGVLNLIGTFATGSFPYRVTFSPVINGNLFAAVTNAVDNTVTVYSVDTITGLFTSVAGSPFATGNGPTGVAFSPFVSGNLFAAITNANSNTVSVYSVNSATGQFTLIQTVSLPATSSPLSIAYSPVVSNNLYAMVPNEIGNAAIIFQVDTATGAFTQVSNAPSGLTPITVGFSPLVNNILLSGVSNFNSANASIYNVDIATGSLSELTSAGSPFATGQNPFGFAFSSVINQRLFFATTDETSGTISVYKVIYAPLLLSAILNCATGLVTVTGSGADTSSTITVFADGAMQIGTGTPDVSGNFNFNTTIPLSGSSHMISVTQTIGSCTTEQSPGVEVQIVISSPVLIDALVNCASGLVQVTGNNVNPSSEITVFSDGTQFLGSGIADSMGNFSFNTSVPLLGSHHTITVIQTTNGCVSAPSNGITLNSNLSSPLLLSAILDCHSNLVHVVGSNASAGIELAAFADGTIFLGSGIADSMGNFNFNTTIPVDGINQTHTITVAQISSVCTSEPSNGIVLSGCISPIISPRSLSSLTQAIINKFCAHAV